MDEGAQIAWGKSVIAGEVIKGIIASIMGGCLGFLLLAPIALSIGLIAAYWLGKMFRVW